MVMDIGFGKTSAVQHAGRRCDASCCSLATGLRLLRWCAKFFGSRPRFLVRLPMMTDTLTRTTVGDESRYSYCLRSQLFVCFRPERLVSCDVVRWSVGGLKLCGSRPLGTGMRHRQVDWRALACCGVWRVRCTFLKDEVAGWKERHVRHFMCIVFVSLPSMVVHVPHMLGFKDRAAFACRVS